MKLILKSNSAGVTSELARNIGKLLRGGEVIILDSDLGGGKTTFAQGLAEGLGIEDIVSSPTFSISNVYESQNLELHHYDFYRLGTDVGIMAEELREVLNDKKTVCVIEWSDSVTGMLPDNRTVRIKLDRQKDGENVRLITIDYPEELKYAIDEDVPEDLRC